MKKIYLSLLLILISYCGFTQLEIPKSDSILYNKSYSIRYSEHYKQPLWSAYKFYKDMTIKKYIRVSTFYIDSRVKNRVTNSDYRKSGYDRGHLTPIANFRFDYLSMQQTNYYTNICPQKPRFNRGIWKKLENKVRKWVLEYDTLYIVSGPIFSDTNKTIGNNLTIPNKFFKTIIGLKNNKYYSIGFVISNEQSDKSIFDYVTTIDSIEKIINFDLYYKLNDKIENKIEKNNNLKY